MSVIRNQPTRAEKKARTRVLLLNAASECFRELGYGATHIAHIARRASVAHGTFYVHFETKQAVLDALLEQFNEDTRVGMEAALVSGDSIDARVEAAALVFLRACVSEASLVRAYAERAAGGVNVEQLAEGINPPARALLYAVLGPLVGDDEVELVSHGLLALWLRVALRVLYADVDVDHAARTLAKMSLGAVRALSVAP